ncbi:pantoate--beta-alanine ligase [Pseudidiomarina salinarum]|uniref:Pantothenate synthetase n=1 Tax=Pseudidiomarina salinarum TaxID=435908 RepID=A0A094L6L4_9GAMM|nr:pantoate--beta-alanine ligase [Pseudidiomarina salinarum]KFZ30348.1 pantoate--beta-alanine ligase [Pseudidiomarina salinarum]RUO68499.1 pantoate--beta-alanine ligase [Pseudidiomarina salinarum]
MQLLKSLEELRAWRKQQRGTLALVPTMGNLHRGHLRLVETAKDYADQVVVSIFVNPMQFGANEDLDSYPRTFDADCHALAELGVNAIFAPTVEDVYPRGLAQQTIVEVPVISDLLCGASRPGHFLGVATVVTKLFNMVQPDVAVFGEKDFQQLQVIRLMTHDLSMPVDVIGIPTERADDGLALSSRNGYLSTEERRKAPVIFKTLQDIAKRIRSGESDAAALAEGYASIEQAGLRIDYLELRRREDLLQADADDKELVVLVAAFAGKTRLIDNLQFDRPS